MIKLFRAGLLCMLLLCGCSWDGTPTRSNDITPLTSIVITADYSSIAAKTSMPFKAMGNYSGEFSRDITDRVTWTSDTPARAAFNNPSYPSRISGLTAGAVQVTASVGTITSSTTVTVTSATISLVTLSPTTPSVAQGLSATFTAQGTFSDSSHQDITFDATWTSGTPAVATIGTTPAPIVSVTSKTLGTTQITATFDGKSDSTTLTVTAPVLQSIAVSSKNGATSLPTMSKLGFTASGTYSNGVVADVTSQVTWSSDSSTLATIDTTGTVTALSPGTATITATLGTIAGSAPLKATGGTLSSFTLSPATVSLVKNFGTFVTATGSFSNGTSRDISRVLSWRPADASFVNVSSSSINSTWLKPLKATTTTSGIVITATAPATAESAKTATTNVTVTDLTASLNTVTLSPGTVGVVAGAGSRLSLAANFNGSGQDVTAVATWSSSDTSKVTVENGVVFGGRITGVTAGNATVTASYGGKSDTSTIRVTAPVIQSLTISGPSSIVAGNKFAYSATVLYGDGSQINVTDLTSCSWSVDKANVAVLATALSQPGQFVAVDVGTATITATFGGLTKTAAITVTGN